MHVYMHVHICLYNACMYICIHTCMYTCIHMHVYITCMHVHVLYIHARALVLETDLCQYYLKPQLAAHWNHLESLKNTDAWIPLQKFCFN